MEELLEKVNSLEQRYLSIKAVLEERKRRKKELEDECRAKGFDPDDLSSEISKLELEKQAITLQLEEKLKLLEKEIEKYESN